MVKFIVVVVVVVVALASHFHWAIQANAQEPPPLPTLTLDERADIVADPVLEAVIEAAIGRSFEDEVVQAAERAESAEEPKSAIAPIVLSLMLTIMAGAAALTIGQAAISLGRGFLRVLRRIAPWVFDPILDSAILFFSWYGGARLRATVLLLFAFGLATFVLKIYPGGPFNPVSFASVAALSISIPQC